MLQRMKKIVEKYSDKKSQTEFMDWFLCSQLSVGDTMLKYLFKYERDLSIENKRKIALYSKWGFNSFKERKSFEKELRELYKSTFTEIEEELSVNQMMKHFLYQYLFGTIHPDKYFVKYNGRVCEKYIRINEYCNYFDQVWNNSNIMILYGEGGLGKTQLIKSYIDENKEKYKEICVLDGCKSICEGLFEIPFLIDGTRELGDIIDRLSNKEEETILVIDIPRLNETDVKFIEKYLLNLKLRIIITTLKRVSVVETVYQKQFKPLDSVILRKIFDSNLNSAKYEMTETQFEKLLSIVDRNTLVIALLGKAIARKEIPIEKLINEQEWIWFEKGIATVHANAYDHEEGKTPIYHIEAILNKYGIMREEYSELAIWCKDEMNVNDLKSWCRFPDDMGNILREAYESGLIEYIDCDNQIIKMHSLIADAIWKFYSIKYCEYQKNIELFLENIKWGAERKLEYHMLYNGLYNMIQRFSFEFQKKKPKGITESYLNNLEWVINFSIQSGNYYGAEKLIYFWNKFSVSNKCQQALWEFEISWAHGDNQRMRCVQEKYKERFKNIVVSKDNIFDMVNAVGDFLKIIMNWYVRVIRTFKGDKEVLKELVEKYLKIVGYYDDSLYDPYKNYYVIVLWCIDKKLLMENDEIDAYCKILDEWKLPEWKMKVKLEILYWQMFFSIIDITNKEFITREILESNYLREKYYNKLWPIEVEILFRQVEILRSILEQDKDVLCEKIKDFSTIFKERIITEKMTIEMEMIQENIPNILRKIESFPLLK